jgi:hypothetical protein
MNPMKVDLEAEYSRKRNEDLLAIVHSQFFRPDAQKLARELLLNRGISEDTINQWRDPDTEFIAPFWSSGMSDLKLRRMLKRHRRLNRISFYLIIIIFVILGLSSDLSLSEKSSGWQILLNFIGAFSGFAIRLLWLRLILLSLLWRAPLRILLFRPFTFPESRKRIRCFTKHYLRYLGHTYTISDTEVKPKRAFLESLQFLLPFLLALDLFPGLSEIISSATDPVKVLYNTGVVFLILTLLTGWLFPLFLPFFNVHSDEDISRLKDFISRRRARNIAWVLSWDKLFKISCTPETWKHTVQHLINSAQLIVVDLSNIGEGLKWELDELRFYGATDKVVFVAHSDSFDSALSFLKSYELSELSGGLFVYGNDGVATRHKELNDKLISIAVRSSTDNRSL